MTKTQQPVISVVVTAYNEEKYIINCLSSVLNQTIHQPYEVIVCDNNSTDKTYSLIQSFPVISVQEKNKSYVSALITGVNQTIGKYVAITDADTVVQPQWLSSIVEAFEKDPKVVGVGGPYYFSDGPFLLRNFVHLINTIYPRLLTASLCGMNMAFNKSVYQHIGGFNTHIALQADTELGYRLKKYGSVIFLKKNGVYTSARRYRSFGQLLKEVTIRILNVLSLVFFHKTIVKSFKDFR